MFRAPAETTLTQLRGFFKQTHIAVTGLGPVYYNELEKADGTERTMLLYQLANAGTMIGAGVRIVDDNRLEVAEDTEHAGILLMKTVLCLGRYENLMSLEVTFLRRSRWEIDRVVAGAPRLENIDLQCDADDIVYTVRRLVTLKRLRIVMLGVIIMQEDPVTPDQMASVQLMYDECLCLVEAAGVVVFRVCLNYGMVLMHTLPFAETWTMPRHRALKYGAQCAMFLVCLWMCDDADAEDEGEWIDPNIVNALFSRGGELG